MLDEVVATLAKTARPDHFCTELTVPADDLEIKVTGAGQIPFPISTQKARSLVRQAKPAHFGRKDQTVFDPKIRHVWEVPKGRIRINRSKWESAFQPALARLKEELGLPAKSRLSAELHNMLVYEAGQFFVNHQDSEKTDGMVATLVVLLPSRFRGGALVVDQHGEKRTFAAPRGNPTQLRLVAFYSDCRHEVKRVTDGYRIALTYNLVLNGTEKQLPAIADEKLVRKIKAYFSKADENEDDDHEGEEDYECSTGHPQWLVYLLDHEYSQQSLRWSGLKGADRSRCAKLRAVADKLGLRVHLALADIHETWSAEEEYESWGYDRYESDDEEDESDDSSGDEDYNLTELVDDEIALQHWVDENDQPVRLPEHSVPKGMICWTKAVEEFQPFNTEYEGYTGNAGNTLDRWYHRAAIVLWRKDSEFASRFALDRRSTLKKIDHLLRKELSAGQSAVLQILPQWSSAGNREDPESALRLAFAVQHPGLAAKLVKPLGLSSLSGRLRGKWLALLEAYGEAWCLDRLHAWLSERSPDRELLLDGLPSLVKCVYPRSETFARSLVDHQLVAWKQDDAARGRYSSPMEVHRREATRLSHFTGVLEAARLSDDAESFRRAIDHVIAHPRLYTATGTAKKLRQEGLLTCSGTIDDESLQRIMANLKGRLEKVVGRERAEGDWSIQDDIGCSCRDCKELGAFLRASGQQTLTWPLAKERRRHLHGVIEGSGISITHVTHRVGSPQKLVLTKSASIFKADRARAAAASEELKHLSAIA